MDDATKTEKQAKPVTKATATARAAQVTASELKLSMCDAIHDIKLESTILTFTKAVSQRIKVVVFFLIVK
jgi:hypothetical protein